jgi:LysM repeat protein
MRLSERGRRTGLSRGRCVLILAFGALAVGGATVVVPAGSAGADTVEVLPGQTLGQLADAYGTTVATLAAVNDIADPNLIVAGTFLVVPTGTGSSGTAASNTGSDNAASGNAASGETGSDDTTTATSAATSSTAATSDGTSVLVSAGDNLSSIAARYGTTVATLARANGISDPNLIIAGTRLVVPVAGAPTPSSAAGAASTAATPSRSTGPPASSTTTTTTAPTTASVTSGTAAGGLPSALVDDPTKLALEPIFSYWAERFGLPSSLLEAMCWWESGWQSGVTSVTGAQGIGQLEPATVSAMQSQIGTWHLAPYTATDNIEMAAAYLHDLMVDTGGTPGLALASYYQGLASVEKIGLLPSTEQYVSGIEAYTTDFS